MGTFPPDERDDPLPGLRVAITGGTSGLGLALVRELHGTPYEPAFTLLDLKDRPLIATFNFRSPPTAEAQTLAALLDRCFAAAYFRRLGLA